MVESKERFPVNPSEIAEASERVKRFLRRQGFGEREAERMRRTVETLLRRVGERFGRAAPCELELGRRLGRAYIRLLYPGAEYDPTLTGREDEGNGWSERLFAELGLIPQWSRRRGVNRLELCPRRRTYGAYLGWGAALLLALLFLLLAGEHAAAIENMFLAPVYDAVLRLWALFSAPLLFFSAASILCGAADTARLGRIGKQMLARFVAASLLWAALGTAASALLLRLPIVPVRGGWAERLSGVLLALIPDAAAARGGVPPLLLGICCGVGVSLLGGRTERVRVLCDQLACLLRTLAECACRLAPLLVFCVLVRLHGGLWEVWKPLTLFLVLSAAAAICKLLLVCARSGESPSLAMRGSSVSGEAAKCLSTDSIIGLSMDCCEKELEISHTLTLLGLPIGNVLCAPVTALCYASCACLLARHAGVEADILWLVGLALLSALLAMALPRVPGTLLLGLSVLLRAMGLPPEGFALLIAAYILLEALCAALESRYLRLALLLQDRLYRNVTE
ncbi:MAG: dicarboxylate/amino acid:cation symporter [Ruminococcaceae bacterium]|nr:dicarboxylate/amino acid:cation symporter [Oscillospiraceae bacterium]